MLIPIENVGEGGIVSDIKPYQLQPNQWSSGNNVSFRNGEISKINGYAEVMKDCPIEPWHLGTYMQPEKNGRLSLGGFFWLAFGEKKIYCNWLNEWYNVTRQDGDGNDIDYNTVSGTNWDVTQSGALLIATNTEDIPQIWQLDNANKVSVGLPFKDMESWVNDNTPGETDLSCQTVEGFKNHIIVTGPTRDFGIQEDEHLSRTVKWSTQHSHYSEPASWDVTNEDFDAGEYELLDTQGSIIDTLPMGELFMVYKSDSVHMMSYVGTPYIFKFKTLNPQIGIIAKGAAVEFPGGHFFISLSDCYVNNGQSVVPILTGKVRDQMFNNINGDFYDRIFCVADIAHNEILACYPSANSEHCDKAMVWNFKDNTFTFRDLPDVTDIKSGVKALEEYYDPDDPTNITWESSDPDPTVPMVPWNSVTTLVWGAVSYANVITNLVMCSPLPPQVDPDFNGKLYRNNAGQTENGEMMYSYVERTGIDLGDPSSVKHLRAIWPKIATKDTHTIDIYTGSQMGTDEPVRWEGPHRYNPDVQSKVSVRTTGKLLGVRFETRSDTNWAISGIELESETSGSRGSRKYA